MYLVAAIASLTMMLSHTIGRSAWPRSTAMAVPVVFPLIQIVLFTIESFVVKYSLSVLLLGSFNPRASHKMPRTSPRLLPAFRFQIMLFHTTLCVTVGCRPGVYDVDGAPSAFAHTVSSNDTMTTAPKAPVVSAVRSWILLLYTCALTT